MKRKLLSLCFILALMFVIGCNKEKQADPTPTAAPIATSTPTPVPENLAQTNLAKLPSVLDAILEQQPDYMKDYANGMGCDVSIDINVNSDLLSFIGITDVNSISLEGTLDYKTSFLANLALFLDETPVMEVSALTDFTNFYFNLPKYSSQYAAISLAELSGTEDLGNFSPDNLPTNADLLNMYSSYLTRFTECFQPQLGIAENQTIGVGDYLVTGNKHTVVAAKEDIIAVLDDFQEELNSIAGILAENAEGSSTEIIPEESDATSLILNYYTDSDNSYAWEITSDSPEAEPVVFVSTPAGFCLYNQEGMEAHTILYSIATTETEGVIYIPADAEEGTTEEELSGEIEYGFDETSFYAEGYFDTIEFETEYSIKNDTINYELEVSVEGITLIMEETATKDQINAEITVASFGVKFGTISITSNMRDYAEITVPQNTVDMETWEASLDMTTLATDMLALIDQYPFLADLLFPETDTPDDFEEPDDYDDWNDPYYDDSTDSTEPFVIPEGYTDDFMGLTGYSVDSYGYVDFTPLEAEVLAVGKPSTGCFTSPVTPDQKQALLDLCSGAFADCYSDVESYYSVWGSIEDNAVASYYQTEYYYSDNTNYNNFIFLTFDAISGDFIGISIYTASPDQSILLANNVMTILGYDAQLTEATLAEYDLSFGDYVVYSYSDETSYSVCIEVYPEEYWN